MRLKRFIILAGFLLLTVFMGTSAAEEKKNLYTLEKSIKEALANNLTLKAKEEQIRQATYVKNQARAEFLPKLGMNYGYRRDSERRTFRSTLAAGQEIAVSSQDNYRWSGILKQPVFTGFALISSYELAKLGIDLSEMQIEQERLNLALRVKEAYFDILITDKNVDVAEKDVESRKTNADVARNFYKVGMIAINELLEAEVEWANAKQALVRAKNDRRLARAVFNTVLSRPINEPVEVVDILDYKPELGSYDEYMEIALKKRPEIKVIDISLLQADQEIRLRKSKNYPEVAFTYEYIKEGDSLDVSGSDFHDAGRWEAMAVATWTFWEWGKTYYSVREIESKKDEAIKTRMALEDRIGLEVTQALLDLETAEKNIPTTRKAVEQGEENLRVSEERYRAQVTIIREVLDAQTRLTISRVNYYRALYGHNLAMARLERAIGRY